MGEILRDKLTSRFAELKKVRQRWEPAVADIAEHMVPYRVQWDWEQSGKQNDGLLRNETIINATPVLAVRTGAAGMSAGITNPTRRWFNITTRNPADAKDPEIRSYLEAVRNAIDAALHASNWYDVLPNSTYPGVLSIGNAAMLEEDDGEGGVRFVPLAFGSYWIDRDDNDKVDVCFRRLRWSVRKIVKRFGYENCSPKVQLHWDKSEYGTMFWVVHAIMPNEEIKRGFIGPDGMAYASYWWEESAREKDKYLRVGGYHEFPVLVAQWSLSEGDTYARGPGWDVLGDCKALQFREARGATIIDLWLDPPLKQRGFDDEASLRPGAVTPLAMGQQADVEPIYLVPPPAAGVLQGSIEKYEGRINQGMYVHLWQSTIQDQRNERATATEIVSRNREVMLMLGPLLQSLDTNLLEPCVRRTFAILDRNDMLPIPPRSLQGGELKIEFISIMHQAQQAAGAEGIRSLMMDLGNASQLDPNVVDKLNFDAVIEQLASMYGVSVELLRSLDEVQKMRDDRQKAQQASQEGEAMLAATEGAKNLSQTDMGKIQDIGAAIAPAAGAAAGGEGLEGLGA